MESGSSKNFNIEKLRQLTKELPEVPTLDSLVQEYQSNRAYYDGDKFWGEALLYIPQVIAVQRVFMATNYQVPKHKHELPVWEFGIIEKGMVQLHYKDEVKNYLTDDVMVFEPEQSHWGTIIEDCTMVFATIPPGKGYPTTEGE